MSFLIVNESSGQFLGPPGQVTAYTRELLLATVFGTEAEARALVQKGEKVIHRSLAYRALSRQDRNGKRRSAL